VRCGDFDPDRRAFFGDLHVHTSYSFDSYGVRNQRNDPAAALRFGAGEAIPFAPFDADGETSTRGDVQIDRPLDFMAVTDHSEFLGEVSLCTDPGSAVYDSVSCRNFRTSTGFEAQLGADLTFAGWGVGLALGTPPQRPNFCGDGRAQADCEAAATGPWQRMQEAAEGANRPCTFTALHGYEWTGQSAGAMFHRNVIFRNATVPARVYSYFDLQNWQDLAYTLKRECKDAGTGCDVLAIPHNPNYSNGTQFRTVDGQGAPYTAETAALRAEMEPLVEIVQTKQESECRNGFSRYVGNDEGCDFEKRAADKPFCQAGEQPCGLGQTPEDDGCVNCQMECVEGQEGTQCVSPLDYVRNVLKAGLVEALRIGVNPFELGFIGSTDTHNATPGNVKESSFRGHHGIQDEAPEDLLGADAALTPGGLAVVWAEENTRESIFLALRRRETYATSGTRPLLRFFGGADLPADACDRADFAAQGYASGVPMGGVLPATTAPRFAIKAQKDPQGVGLQRIQMVKIWVDEAGAPQEAVIDVTPALDTSAGVDLSTCAPTGPQREEICTVWQDPDFEPGRPAIYYVRLLENPSCRWSQSYCNDLRRQGAALPEACDNPAVPQQIQERAWSSPIYLQP
jgi:hypothetical protein